MRKAVMRVLTLGLLLAAMLWVPASANAEYVGSNHAPIAIPDGFAPASPYPSTFTTPALTGSITGIRVILPSVTFPDGDDLGILLQAPSGQALPLLNGGPSSISGAGLQFYDLATEQVPIGAPLTSPFAYSYRPTSYYSDDDFPAGGPSHLQYQNPGPDLGGAATLASTFNGINANGIWKLWVADFDTGPHTGQIGRGWSVVLSGVSTDTRFTLGTPRIAKGRKSASILATFPNDGEAFIQDSALTPIPLGAHKKKRKRLNRPLVVSGTVPVAVGTTTIPIGLTHTALKLLTRLGKLTASARITYLPRARTPGTGSRQIVGLTFTTTRHRKHKRR